MSILWGAVWFTMAVCFLGNHAGWWDLPLIVDELRMAMTCGMIGLYATLAGLKKW